MNLDPYSVNIGFILGMLLFIVIGSISYLLNEKFGSMSIVVRNDGKRRK